MKSCPKLGVHLIAYKYKKWGYRYKVDGQRIIALESLKKLEELLPADKFIRIHKSYIVAIDMVKVVEGNTVHIAGKKLPIGASYREAAMQKLF